MRRGNTRVSGLLLLLSCLALGASSARATQILIDDFGGTPAVGVYSISPSAIGLGFVLPLGSTNELDYLGDLMGMRVEYGSLGPLDLTAMSNDALSLDILDLVPSAGPLHLAVSVNGVASTGAFEITSTGPFLLPYDSFTVPGEFSSVSTLKLTFTSDSPFAFAANNLQAVPEPSTVALMGLGLLGLAMVGRRQTA